MPEMPLCRPFPPARGPCPAKLPFLALLALFPLALGACNTEKRGYRQAGEVHGKSIAFVAGLAPFLAPRDDVDEVSYRYVSRSARAEIVKHGLASAEYQSFAPSGARLTPVERVGAAFARLLPHCTLTDLRDSPAEQEKNIECQGAVKDFGRELDRIAAEAERLHLPRGTIPRLDEGAITPEARRLRNDLTDIGSPVVGELVRRRLWQDPSTTEAAIREACASGMREAKTRPAGVSEQVQRPCSLLKEASANLGLVAACQKQRQPHCLQPSLCGVVIGYVQQQDELPVIFADRIRAAAALCQVHLGIGEQQGGPEAPEAPTSGDGGPAPKAGDGGPAPGSPASDGGSGEQPAAPADTGTSP